MWDNQTSLCVALLSRSTHALGSLCHYCNHVCCDVGPASNLSACEADGVASVVDEHLGSKVTFRGAEVRGEWGEATGPMPLTCMEF